MSHKYTMEQKEFIKNNVKGSSSRVLTEMVNNQFNLNLSVAQIRAFMKNYSLSNGICTRFKKGNTPHNKGKKGMGGWKPTQYKKGHIPATYLPVGSERVNGDGYVDIKVADPNKWRGKHILIWEQHNGPIPEGHAIIFADRDKRNFNIDNLLCITRAQLLIMNKNKLIKSDTNLTRTGAIIAELQQKIYERK